MSRGRSTHAVYFQVYTYQDKKDRILLLSSRMESGWLNWQKKVSTNLGAAAEGLIVMNCAVLSSREDGRVFSGNMSVPCSKMIMELGKFHQICLMLTAEMSSHVGRRLKKSLKMSGRRSACRPSLYFI